MDELYQNLVRLSPKEQVPFRCIGCGECCRHVHMQVPVETLDAFRIVKHLQQQGEDIECMDDFWERYTEPALLNECGFSCIFSNARTGKPFSCRIIDAGFTRSIRELAGYIRSL
ncbi:MAG: YkgJ family cysteine cluster protein [Christensenellales bacterium]